MVTTEPGRGLRKTTRYVYDWTHQYLGHVEASRDRFGA